MLLPGIIGSSAQHGAVVVTPTNGLAEWIRNHADVSIAAGAVVWTKYI